MILIKNIDFIEVDGTFHDVFRANGNQVEIELVRGRNYYRPDGTEVCVGVAQDPQNVLGLLYDEYENTRNENRYSKKVLASLRSQVKGLSSMLKCEREALEKYESAGFFTRLKWLFTGVK